MGKVTEKVEQFKAWYKSKTIIGLAISSVSGIVFAMTSGKVDVQGAVDTAMGGADDLASGADNIIAGVMFFVGQAIAVYGRFKAKVGLA